jgi:uncharacterized protein YfaS (alpha-2-macroglobulin family)
VQRVEKAGEDRGSEWFNPVSKRREWREETGSASVFRSGDSPSAFNVTKPAGSRPMEVVGIPLQRSGLYVVELESHALGAALLGPGKTRYVATAALVTNISVHFKWGRESSLVWVTALDDGRPVEGATVSVSGMCDGGRIWQGKTDRSGIARVRAALGEPGRSDSCTRWSSQPLIVVATLGEDFSFALSGWHKGIAPYDFGLRAGQSEGAEVYHTVLDRSLFRPGETVSMKHYLRRHVGTGISIPVSLPATRRVVLAHEGSDTTYEYQVPFGSDGIGEQQWAIPREAKVGDYSISIEDERHELRLAGEFKVADFRLPTMRAAVRAADPTEEGASRFACGLSLRRGGLEPGGDAAHHRAEKLN